MESTKTITLSLELYEKLEKLKKANESIEAVIERLLKNANNMPDEMDWSATCKFLMVGPAGGGKTSIRKFFFENADPLGLLSGPQDPTINSEEFLYKWFDISVKVVDSNESDMALLLKGKNNDLLSDVNGIIYVIDMNQWQEHNEKITADVKDLAKILKKHAPNSRLYAFINKKDLVEKSLQVSMFMEIQDILTSVVEDVQLSEPLECYNTSIKPEFSIDVLRAMRNILFRYSSNLKRILIPSVVVD
ncbi:MAG: DUF7557 family protein [Promethearchaeota archaeon]